MLTIALSALAASVVTVLILAIRAEIRDMKTFHLGLGRSADTDLPIRAEIRNIKTRLAQLERNTAFAYLTSDEAIIAELRNDQNDQEPL